MYFNSWDGYVKHILEGRKCSFSLKRKTKRRKRIILLMAVFGIRLGTILGFKVISMFFEHRRFLFIRLMENPTVHSIYAFFSNIYLNAFHQLFNY